MTGFEYKVVPAPMRGLKAKGVKGTPARFANALQTVMNDLGADGWDYQRADTLPVEERQGLTGKSTSFQNMLVFRRPLVSDIPEAPESAALIEDHPEVVINSSLPVMNGETPILEDQIEQPEPEAAKAEDFIGDVEETPTQENTSTRSLEAQDRVRETLKAPFVFPWSRRRTAAPEAKSEDTQHPAE